MSQEEGGGLFAVRVGVGCAGPRCCLCSSSQPPPTTTTSPPQPHPPTPAWPPPSPAPHMPARAPDSGMNDDIIRFFSRSTHCRPEVIRRIVADIDTVTSTLHLSRKVTTWGTTEQPKICLYGGLPIATTLGSSKDKKTQWLIPIQVWITHQYPIEPPTVYLVSSAITGDGGDASFQSNAVVKVISNHPHVDLTGLCYCKELSEWKPTSSSICQALEQIGRNLEAYGLCPLYIDENPEENVLAASAPSRARTNGDDGKGSDDGEEATTDACVACFGPRDTVLVPCGHFCLCISCAANVTNCPICRTKIQVRQKIFF